MKSLLDDIVSQLRTFFCFHSCLTLLGEAAWPRHFWFGLYYKGRTTKKSCQSSMTEGHVQAETKALPRRLSKDTATPVACRDTAGGLRWRRASQDQQTREELLLRVSGGATPGSWQGRAIKWVFIHFFKGQAHCYVIAPSLNRTHTLPC